MKTTVLKNAGVTVLTQIINLILKFILQRAFIEALGVSYLGYNSVFTNILQMLNLADLGIGVAITGFLYEPIAKDEKYVISALMSLYRHVYFIMGTIVIILGGVIQIILPTIIPDADCSNNYLRLLFAINLIGVLSTYFIGYNRTLLVAQQKAYFVNMLDTLMNIVFIIAQIIMLYVSPNYIIFLLLNVVKNVCGNVIISISCNRNNSFLRSYVNKDIYNQYKSSILLSVKDVFISKIGAYIYYGTDNIIISIFRGSLLAGYLANYTLITTTLQAIIDSVFVSLQAVFGNLVVTTDKNEDRKEASDAYLFFNYVVANICLVCCMFVFQPFIRLYIGNEFLLNGSTVCLLSINLFFSIMLIVPSHLFIIFKLFKYDKIIILCSATLNIIISTFLVQIIGVDGVLIGTLVTSIIYVVSRMYIIDKYVFEDGFTRYIFNMILWIIKSAITIGVISFFVKGIIIDNWFGLVVYSICIFIASAVIPVLLSLWNKEVKSLWIFLKK